MFEFDQYLEETRTILVYVVLYYKCNLL